MLIKSKPSEDLVTRLLFLKYFTQKLPSAYLKYKRLLDQGSTRDPQELQYLRVLSVVLAKHTELYIKMLHDMNLAFPEFIKYHLDGAEIKPIYNTYQPMRLKEPLVWLHYVLKL